MAIKRKWMSSLCSGADRTNHRQEINTEKNSKEITKVLLAKSQGLLFLPYTLTLQQVHMGKFIASVMEMHGLYEVKCPWKHRNKTMKEYVAQGSHFL